MNQKELKELIEFLIEKDIAEFELERGDVKVRIKRGVMVSARLSSCRLQRRQPQLNRHRPSPNQRPLQAARERRFRPRKVCIS